MRIPAAVRIHDGKVDSAKQHGTITNLSHLAATVDGPLMIPAGAPVAVSFTLPGMSNSITAFGRTSAQKNEAGNPPARGWTLDIQFTHLTASDQSQIRLWVSQQPDEPS